MSESKMAKKDQTFILSLVASGITVLGAVVSAIGAYLGNPEMTNAGMEVLKYTFPLTTTSWAFYFKAKRD